MGLGVWRLGCWRIVVFAWWSIARFARMGISEVGGNGWWGVLPARCKQSQERKQEGDIHIEPHSGGADSQRIVVVVVARKY